MSSKMIRIDFHGEPLWAVSRDGDVFVAVRPICEALGLEWGSQLKGIKRDAVLGKGVVKMTTPSSGGHQRAVCLPLKLLNGWLFGISDGSIPDEAVRAKVILYKTECYDVLFQHFHGKAQSVVYSDPEFGDLQAHPLAGMFPLLPEAELSRLTREGAAIMAIPPAPAPLLELGRLRFEGSEHAQGGECRHA